ncbi:hypothetical protein Scep_008325 [Stephania cephalantha]|uniref:Heparanase-like protein 3 n=1 Tax=Stephania cephalantha TaxID=152367 RepID=A0AAP0KD91_9MAGN
MGFCQFRILCLYLCLICFTSLVSKSVNVLVEGASPSVEGSVVVDGKVGIGRTDGDFICATLDWWPPEKCDYGTCSWGHDSLLNLDIYSNVLINAVKAFSPLKIRLGGTLQDKVVYDVGEPKQRCLPFVKNASELFGFTQGCLPMWRWDQLNQFFQKTGAVVIFGLNALNGRTINPEGSAVGPWDSSNAASLIRYSVSKGYNIYAWELGNELSGSGVGTRVTADQYAADVKKLHSVVEEIYIGSKVKPLIIAPGGFFDGNWFKQLIQETPNSLDVVTHHIYNLGPGVDTHLIDKILDPSYLDGEAKTFNDLKDILTSSGTAVTAWVGEAGGAYNSGRNQVTNAFVFSFWYLDQLGMSSTYDTKAYCRQTLIGGNYGLLNTTTFLPNPDYYSALLWHRLMGRTVLRTNFTGTNKIRAYSHCAKHSEGITLLLINLDGNNTVQAHIVAEPAASNGTWSPRLRLRHHGRHRHNRTRFARLPRAALPLSPATREEYHLTAKDGDIQSQTMLLNGKVLAVNSLGEIPPFEPINVNSSEPVTVAPYSIVFVHIPSLIVPACK